MTQLVKIKKLSDSIDKIQDADLKEEIINQLFELLMHYGVDEIKYDLTFLTTR